MLSEPIELTRFLSHQTLEGGKTMGKNGPYIHNQNKFIFLLLLNRVFITRFYTYKVMSGASNIDQAPYSQRMNLLTHG